MSLTSKQKGFTLIELLVVISIISLLASVLLVALNGARSKARDAKRKAELKQLSTALELFAQDNGGQYPAPLGLGTPTHCISSTNWNCWGVPGDTNKLISSNYVSKMPQDPQNVDDGNACDNADEGSRLYAYTTPDRKSYILATRLENILPTDPGYFDNAISGLLGCLGFANYAVRVGY